MTRSSDHLGNILLFGGCIRFDVSLENVSLIGECSPCLFIFVGDRFRFKRTLFDILMGLSMSTMISMRSNGPGEELVSHTSPPHSCDVLSAVSVYMSLGVGRSWM